MCGICGLISRHRKREQLGPRLEGMVRLLAHRGPDDSRVWVDPTLPVGLGHRRLSVIDLSLAGRQPLESPDGRWVLSYNGEIYNYRELRSQLEKGGLRFRGDSDSEVVAGCLQHWGVEATLKRLLGMFALAAWDRQEQRLLLARDRLGQKPLFYGFWNDELVFGSEVRVLRALEGRPPIDPEAVALMLRYQGIPAPHCIYQGFYKLVPGSYRIFSFREWSLGPRHFYWDPWSQAAQPRGESFTEALEGVKSRLSEAVKARMISDVPLGAFLSGGIDSSLVVSLMCQHSTRPVKTFTIGYYDLAFDEGKDAREVARYLGTEHTEFRLSPSETLEVVPRLGEIYDEPFSDRSQLPTYLVSKMARGHVTVALSGDGGDEMFGGYNRHVWLPSLGPRILEWPRWLRRALGRIIRWPLTQALVDQAVSRGWLKMRLPRNKMDKVARMLRAQSVDEMYRWLVSEWVNPNLVVPAARSGVVDEFRRVSAPPHSLQRYAMADALLYLPDVILAKVDRASMACGLEARAPFLDHRLVEYALTLEPTFKVKGRVGKHLLRHLLKEFLPLRLFDRPKMGFDVPIRQWLRTELRPWAENLLHCPSTRALGLLNWVPIEEAWSAHVRGESDESGRLWSVLMLIAWLQANR